MRQSSSVDLAFPLDVDLAAVVEAMGFLQQVFCGFANLDASRKAVAFHAPSGIDRITPQVVQELALANNAGHHHARAEISSASLPGQPEVRRSLGESHRRSNRAARPPDRTLRLCYRRRENSGGTPSLRTGTPTSSRTLCVPRSSATSARLSSSAWEAATRNCSRRNSAPWTPVPLPTRSPSQLGFAAASAATASSLSRSFMTRSVRPLRSANRAGSGSVEVGMRSSVSAE